MGADDRTSVCVGIDCGASIIWCVTPRHKRLPLNAEPVATGQWVLEERRPFMPIARPVDLFTESERPRYRVHWADCPNAEDFRRERS